MPRVRKHVRTRDHPSLFKSVVITTAHGSEEDVRRLVPLWGLSGLELHYYPGQISDTPHPRFLCHPSWSYHIFQNGPGPCIPSNSRTTKRCTENSHHHPFGLFEFLRMRFGLENAAQTFQRFIDQVLSGLHFSYTYIDDV